MKTRAEVARELGEYYSRKFNGNVWASFDESKRAYCIQGEGLPAAKEMQEQYPNGWSLLDYIPPTKARQLIA